MIRARTLWPRDIGGFTFRCPNGMHWRRNAAGNGWASEGTVPTTVGQDWPVGPARERRISWWRKRLAARRAIDRVTWRHST
jgi:hypothetical protein